jgi:hypothetical protein
VVINKKKLKKISRRGVISPIKNYHTRNGDVIVFSLLVKYFKSIIALSQIHAENENI